MWRTGLLLGPRNFASMGLMFEIGLFHSSGTIVLLAAFLWLLGARLCECDAKFLMFISHKYAS